jgi:valyl-tRNA synthetase
VSYARVPEGLRRAPTIGFRDPKRVPLPFLGETMRELPKTYDPKAVEETLYREWEMRGYFAPSGEGEPFCIVLPPPNVTGALHMGHALDHTLQDALVRRRRMQGFNTLWLPGSDHAGIATQNVVEREIAKEDGTTRHDLGREAFVKRVWEWKQRYGDRITRQMRRLGDSVDWSRERFTMDEDLSRAVREVFVSLYDEGLIYRGVRIINWCPRCRTALSDIEVEHSEVEGELVQLMYPIDEGGHITIATTRVETMLADVAVAVHPSDKRFAHLLGKTVTLPIIGRKLRIIADEAIDPGFGTGALKVTPAHDPIDFEIAQRHGLEASTVIGLDGRIEGTGTPFEGMDRFEARAAVLQELRSQGFVGEEQRPYIHAVGHCSRCNTEVEPLMSEQWFVRVETLARVAIDAVRDERTSFVPKKYERNYYDWMENLRDWCISRQLWWGHRIPVWTCDNGHQAAYRNDPGTCATCNSPDLTQDEDVLDTWFSSALWAFSTLGWPERTEDLATWFPTSVLVTGYDIITFWVSRMMMLTLHFMDEVPFRHVLIHGLVRDNRGRKVSKSLGNALDPLDLIDKYGADAMRMTLARGATLGSDVPLDEKWIEGDRNFCNKLWNITRFVLMSGEGGKEDPPREALGLADRWILSRLQAATDEADAAMEAFDFARAAQTLRQFTWTEFADWYVEWSKGRLYDGTEQEKRYQRAVLYKVLERVLLLLHPITPFITEELWRALTGGETIMRATWPARPEDREPSDRAAEDQMEFLMGIVSSLRRFRADHEIEPAAQPHANVQVTDQQHRELLEQESERIRRLARWGTLTVSDSSPGTDAAYARLTLSEATIHVPLEGLLDLDAERARLSKERAKHEAEAQRLEAKLADKAFTQRAPEDVVQMQRDRLIGERDVIARIDDASRDLS